MNNTIPEIKKETNGFSFVQEIFNEINNVDFYSSAINNFNKKDLSSDGQQSTEFSYIYNTLSAIGEDVFSKIYEEILHYIDNITDIDLCKVKTLQSITKLLGVNYTIFSNINKIPKNILNIIDIFSINSNYLLSSNKIDSAFQTYLLSNSNDLSNDLNDIISSYLFNDISNVLESKYYIDGEKVYSQLSTSIILSGFQLPVNDIDAKDINQMKIKLNIPISFDQMIEADKIYNNEKNFNDYSIAEQELIKFELKRREKPYLPGKLETRYSYYTEKQFKEYYQFIEHEYYNDINDILIYDVDNTYFELANNSLSSLLSVNTAKTESIINYEIVNSVIKKIIYIINQIKEIRETLKTQVQKNFMKGTFLLLSYIIKEYIFQLLKFKNITIDYQNIDIDVLEYNDITQYYNISTDISNDINDNTLNPKFWINNTQFKYVKPYNDNNIFKLPDTITFNQQFISEIDISDFYINTINTKFKQNNTYYSNNEQTYLLSNFLSTIFDSAADKMYLSEISGNNIINYFDKDGNCQQIELSEQLTDVFKEYKRNVFLQYSGYKKANNPYYYLINVKHPSYELHPYIKNFVEKVKDIYPIQNIINFVDNSISDNIIQNIDNYLDNDGYILSAWNIYTNSNSDYQSKYELKTHKNKLNQIDPIINYTGLFYPDAILDLIHHKIDFLSTLSSDVCQNRWYNGLNLTKEERIFISEKIDQSFYILSCIATEDQFDIYKYIEDIFGNQYFVIKDYNKTSPTTFEKMQSPGILLFKPKDFPIAMIPCLSSNSDYSFITNDDNTNSLLFKNLTEISNIINSKFDDKNHTTIPIYDIEVFDQNTQFLMFNTKNNENNCLDLIIKNEKYFDIITNRNKYCFNYIKSKDSYNNIDSSGIQLLSCDANFSHIKYITLNDQFISFYANINNDNKVDILVQKLYQLNNSYLTNNISTEINLCTNIDNISSICFDITNTGLLTIAYLSDYNISSSNISNILDEEYNNTLPYNYYDNIIVTHDFNILNNEIKHVDTHLSTLYYNTHSDMGFIPIVIGENYKNDFTKKSIIINERSVEKIQIFGDKTGDLSDGINFKFTIPLRLYDNSKEFTYDNLEHLAFDSINKNSISNVVQDGILTNPYLPLKTDEGYIEDIFVQHPSLLYTDDYISEEYILSSNNHINVDKNIAKFKIIMENKISSVTKFLSNNLISNISEISVQWYKNDDDDDQIKLDFNSYFAISNDLSSELSTNERNKYHLFLNLDKPGDAGYLNIYHKDDNNIEQLQQYYIKNISDLEPKFIISAIVNHENNDFENIMNMLSTDDGIICFDQENGLLEYMKVE